MAAILTLQIMGTGESYQKWMDRGSFRHQRTHRRRWAAEPHRQGACSVSLVKQHSIAACVPGVSFGCGSDPAGRMVWVRNCRGVFRCSGDSKFHCGWPIGRVPNMRYNCSCDPREQIMPGCTTPVCFRLRMKVSVEADMPASASLVVIGAHKFGGDSNDPVFASVAPVAWSRVLLVEASPPVAAALRARVAEVNPTPNVKPDRVSSRHDLGLDLG